jgi:hypothetical protein
MTWRIKKDRWPNGREFWTVENREESQVLVGQKGGITRYYNRDQAKAASAEMNGRPSDPGPELIEEPTA